MTNRVAIITATEHATLEEAIKASGQNISDDYVRKGIADILSPASRFFSIKGHAFYTVATPAFLGRGHGLKLLNEYTVGCSVMDDSPLRLVSVRTSNNETSFALSPAICNNDLQGRKAMREVIQKKESEFPEFAFFASTFYSF